MVKIRLRRVGAKKQPSYRVVVADSRAPRDGRFIETIGHYNPRTEPPTVVIHEDRALYWLSVGAQPSEPVARFFHNLGLPAKLAQVHDGTAIADVAAPRPQAPAGKPAPAAKTAPARAVKAVVTETVVAPAEAPAEPLAEPVPEEAVAAVEAAAAPAVEVEPVAETVEAVQPVPAATEILTPEAAAPAPAPSAGAAAMPLSDLGLSPRVVKALEAEGVATAGQLATRLADGTDALLAIAGIGAKAVEEIAQKLAEHGLAPEA